MCSPTLKKQPMSKKIVTLVLLLGCLSAVGCSSAKREKAAQEKAAPQRLVGNDKDSHGCLPSAGYQWSELLKDCIRPFEKGVRLDPAGGNPVNGMTCLVFNADSSKVEVFLPTSSERPVLVRQQQADTWVSPSDPTLTVHRKGGVWSAVIDGEVKYQSK